MKILNFGILATGKIAHRLATTMRDSKSCRLVAAASRSESKARHFADEFGVEAVTGYAELLLRDDIDAVYVATPHPQHYEWCLQAIEHGKHILCEKPFTMKVAEAESLYAAAHQKGILIMEAFMYRFHPQTRRLVELIKEGAIGDVRWIHADFGFASDYNPASRLFANSLGGGGILDVGCYTVSMTRMIAGAAQGQAFLDPVEIKSFGRLNEGEGTDWLAGALMDFPGDLLATVRCAMRFKVGQAVRIEGTKGIIELNEPWFAGAKGATIRVKTEVEELIIETETSEDLYSFMLDEFALCWREGRVESPIMSPSDSLGNIRVLEEWYRQVGVVYV